MKNKIKFLSIILISLSALIVYAWIDGDSLVDKPIKKTQLDELRSAIDWVRNDVGLSSYSWTDGDVTGMPIKAVHFSELRTAINAVYTTVGVSEPTWEGTIAAGGEISAVFMTQPRYNLTSINSTITSYDCCGGGACPSTDDTACGNIDCDPQDEYVLSAANSASGTNYCYFNDYDDITSNRCEGINDCKESTDCTYGQSTQATAGLCKQISGCSGSTSGTVSDYSDCTACGSDLVCSSGSCVSGWTSSGAGWVDYTDDTYWASALNNVIWSGTSWYDDTGVGTDLLEDWGLPSCFRPTKVLFTTGSGSVTFTIFDTESNYMGDGSLDEEITLIWSGYDIDSISVDGTGFNFEEILFYEP